MIDKNLTKRPLWADVDVPSIQTELLARARYTRTGRYPRKRR